MFASLSVFPLFSPRASAHNLHAVFRFPIKKEEVLDPLSIATIKSVVNQWKEQSEQQELLQQMPDPEGSCERCARALPQNRG